MYVVWIVYLMHSTCMCLYLCTHDNLEQRTVFELCLSCCYFVLILIIIFVTIAYACVLCDEAYSCFKNVMVNRGLNQLLELCGSLYTCRVHPKGQWPYLAAGHQEQCGQSRSCLSTPLLGSAKTSLKQWVVLETRVTMAKSALFFTLNSHQSQPTTLSAVFTDILHLCGSKFNYTKGDTKFTWKAKGEAGLYHKSGLASCRKTSLMPQIRPHAANQAPCIIQLTIFLKSLEAIAILSLDHIKFILTYPEPHHHHSALLPYASSSLHYNNTHAHTHTHTHTHAQKTGRSMTNVPK